MAVKTYKVFGVYEVNDSPTLGKDLYIVACQSCATLALERVAGAWAEVAPPEFTSCELHYENVCDDVPSPAPRGVGRTDGYGGNLMEGGY